MVLPATVVSVSGAEKNAADRYTRAAAAKHEASVFMTASAYLYTAVMASPMKLLMRMVSCRGSGSGQ